MLTQRLRWAQGTVQVMFRENPLVQKGLSLAQRLMYFATMWSYLSGFAAIVYIAAPVIYLTLGVLPVSALSTDFFIRLVPFLVVNQLLFFVVAATGRHVRGQQYSLALFPVWIRSFTSRSATSSWVGRSTSRSPRRRSAVTRHRWDSSFPALRHGPARVRPGRRRLPHGDRPRVGAGDLVQHGLGRLRPPRLLVVISAVRYRGFRAGRLARP